MDNCIFCKIIKGEIPGKFVHQDDDVVVIEDIHPQAPVHLLVIPKTHVAEFVEADDPLVHKVFATAKRMILEKRVMGYRLVTNGKGAAQVDHLHVHILGNVAPDRTL